MSRFDFQCVFFFCSLCSFMAQIKSIFSVIVSIKWVFFHEFVLYFFLSLSLSMCFTLHFVPVHSILQFLFCIVCSHKNHPVQNHMKTKKEIVATKPYRYSDWSTPCTPIQVKYCVVVVVITFAYRLAYSMPFCNKRCVWAHHLIFSRNVGY